MTILKIKEWLTLRQVQALDLTRTESKKALQEQFHNLQKALIRHSGIPLKYYTEIYGRIHSK